MSIQTIVIVIAVLIVLYLLFRIFKAILKWLLLGLAVLLGLAYFSNPEEPDHKTRLKEAAKDLRIKVREKNINVDDYKIFSLTKVTVNGEEKIVGIGAFGKVWHFGELEEKLKKKKKERS